MNNNERVISDPEVAGWELDPDTGYWMWKGEEGTGGGLWEANGDDIYYSLGNVGVGTNDPSTKFDVSFSSDNTSSANHADDNAGIKSTNTGSGRNLLKLMGVGGSGIAWGQNGTDTSFTFTDRNSSDSGPRLTIDSAGDATFSGTVTSSSLKTDCAKFASNQDHAYLVAGTAGWTGATDNWNTYGFQHRIKTNANGKPRVTIDTALGEKFSVDNDGSATFSGTVSAGEIKVPRSKDGAFSGAFGPSSTDDTAVTLKNAGGSGSSLTLTANNTAEFSGTVDAAGLTINGKPVFESISGDLNGNGWGWRHPTAPNKEGVFLTNNGEFFCPSINGRTSLGTTLQKWRDANLSGTVNSTRMIQDGSPVIDAKGLINTLSTLRNATKDETTLKGMRDALADAIGGLIENLEHEIATMPAPEPEVSTMEIEA